MSRTPQIIFGALLFIICLSVLGHYHYNSRKGVGTPQSSFQLDAAGGRPAASSVPAESGIVETAVEGAKNYWNTVLDKYSTISNEVTEWVQGDAEAPTTGRSPVSAEEIQRAAELWQQLGSGQAVAEAAPQQTVSSAHVGRAAPAQAMSVEVPAIKRRGSIVQPPGLDNSNPSGKHVANSFAEAAKFLSYGDKGYVAPVTATAPVAPLAPAASTPALGKKAPRGAANEKGNRRMAKTDIVLPDTPPPSKDPPINMELVKKYSQRAYYQRSNSSQQGLEDEDDFPKLHMCITAGEAYGAAWLATRRHLIYGGVNQFNLTWVNCEMASFTVMGSYRRVMKPTGVGIIMQSVDVLDYSVLHLSTFERSHKKYQAQLWPDRRIRKVAWHNIDPVIAASAQVEFDVKARMNYAQNAKPARSHFAERTIVVMPFLGGAMGAGHSVLSNRYHYLKACFWSIFEFYPHIVMAVTQAADVTWGKEESGMPWYDVVLLENLPKSASLPMASVQYTRRMLLSGTWDFDYVYYTESDQILMMRNMEHYHKYLDAFPLRVLVPHRLMVYSETVMQEIHQRTKRSPDPMAKKELLDVIPTKSMPKTSSLRAGAKPADTLNDWRDLSCCMPRQNCHWQRDTWIPVGRPNGVPLLNYSGLMIPLGNSNFLLESYRSCTMQPKPLLGETSFCP